jgi:hypothetical protein
VLAALRGEALSLLAVVLGSFRNLLGDELALLQRAEALTW